MWLLSITRSEALDLDATPRDSCSSLSADDGGHSASPETTLPVLLRWHDVHAARRKIAGGKMQTLVLRLRGHGYTQREIAAVFEEPKTTMRRRYDATVTEIVKFLGQVDDEDLHPTINACLICGVRPRVRLAAEFRIRKNGRKREIHPERPSTVCELCLSPVLGRMVLVVDHQGVCATYAE